MIIITWNLIYRIRKIKEQINSVLKYKPDITDYTDDTDYKAVTDSVDVTVQVKVTVVITEAVRIRSRITQITLMFLFR